MKKQFIVVCAIVAVMMMSVFPSFAQEDSRTIQVVGTGTAFGAPDIATVEVGVDIRDADFGTAFDTANETMTTVLAEITGLGIAEEDIQTTSINVWFEDDYNPQTGVPTGERIYHVTQSMRILVRDIAMISDVITTAVDNGANQIYGLSFSFSDTQSLQSTAREIAVDNARVKAEHLAELLGVKLGDVVSVKDLGVNDYSPGFGGAYDRAESIAVASGQLSVTANLQISFAIK